MSGTHADPMRVVGRYLLHGEIASGGMAVVHAGRLLGPVGFARTVAIKRLRDQFAQDPEFVSMLLDEARLAARIQHPNVVSTLDIVALKGELLLVMEYVHGVALSKLLFLTKKARKRIEPHIAISIATGILFGLHAAHEARRENGEQLAIVHRDINPQNVIVGADGVSRVLDFGIAKASFRYQHTGVGMIKGKIAHMAPEHIMGDPVDRRADIYAASLVLWELLTLRKPYHHDDPKQLMAQILAGTVEPPSIKVPDLPPALDAIVMRGLARDPGDRWPTARDMAVELEKAVAPATAHQVGEWVCELGSEKLEELTGRLAAMEGAVANVDVAPAPPDEPRAPMTSRPTDSGTPGPRTFSLDSLPYGPPLDPSHNGITSVASSFPTAEGPPPPRARSRVSALVIVAGIAPVLVAVSVLLWVFLSARNRSIDTPPDSPLAVSSALPALPTQQVSVASAVRDVPPAAMASSTPEVDAGAAEPPAAPSASAAASRKPPILLPGARPGCRPPYTIGPDGVKRYKPECF